MDIEELKGKIKDYKFKFQIDKDTVDFNFASIFRIFTEYFVDDFSKLGTIQKDFYSFVFTNQEIFDICIEDEQMFKYDLVSFCNNLKKIQLSRPKNEVFANVVSHILGEKGAINLLDVGAGSLAYSSLILSQSSFNVSSMDKNSFAISNTVLNRLGITPIKEKFDESTDISQFDAVVGQEPCSAIEAIVKKCSQSNKPYIIETCDCYRPIIEDENGNLKDWSDILPAYDPDIKFLTICDKECKIPMPLAFNVGVSAEEFSKRCEEIEIETNLEILP